jgi:hypothetical protein
VYLLQQLTHRSNLSLSERHFNYLFEMYLQRLSVLAAIASLASAGVPHEPRHQEGQCKKTTVAIL